MKSRMMRWNCSRQGGTGCELMARQQCDTEAALLCRSCAPQGWLVQL
jgi:hypothetical protein